MRVGRGRILRRGLEGACMRPRTTWSGVQESVHVVTKSVDSDTMSLN